MRRGQPCRPFARARPAQSANASRRCPTVRSPGLPRPAMRPPPAQSCLAGACRGAAFGPYNARAAGGKYRAAHGRQDGRRGLHLKGGARRRRAGGDHPDHPRLRPPEARGDDWRLRRLGMEIDHGMEVARSSRWRPAAAPACRRASCSAAIPPRKTRFLAVDPRVNSR